MAGTWYVDEDLSGPYYMIDDNGGWEYYVREAGSTEGQLVDSGHLEADGESTSFLKMISDMGGAISDLFVFDMGILTLTYEDGSSCELVLSY